MHPAISKRYFGIVLLSLFFSVYEKATAQPPDWLWANGIGGTNADVGFSIVLDGSGNIYTTGWFEGTVDFDPGAEVFNLTSSGSGDIFISKLNGSGNFLWAKAMGGTSNDAGYSMALDASGNVYTTGHFQGTVDFDPGAGVFNLTSAGEDDIFLSKLDVSGNFEWARAMGATGADFGYSITLDSSENVYTTGWFYGTVDFDPGGGVFNLVSAGSRDIFISKLDGSGNFVWATAPVGTGNDQGWSIALDASNNAYLTGGSGSTSLSFGTITLTDPGGFIAKLDGTPPCTKVTSSADSGSGTLRDVISCSSNGATITFDSALIDQTITLTSGEISIKKDVILSGLGMSDLTISGNNASRIFRLLPGWNLELHDMALKDATSVTDGGAILVEGNLIFENVLLENNFENGAPKGMTVSPGAVVTILGNVDVND